MRSLASRKSLATSSATATTATNGIMPPLGRFGMNGDGNNGKATSNNFAMINGSRAPPRPAPSLVKYSDEDDSAKGYDLNPDEEDSDSLTEKPSDISSTDSQVC
jgi:hypothetical protein